MPAAVPDDDFFDFSSEILGHTPPKAEIPTPTSTNEISLTMESEVQTSYLLVNALLNLLVQKGIIYPNEISSLVSELHQEYIKKKHGG